jgi:hypothetical protein
VGFSVDPGGVKQLSGALQVAADDATLIEQRVRDHTIIGWAGEGMLNSLKADIEHTHQWAQSVPRSVATLLDSSAAGFTQAATVYEHTDREAAKTYDRFYPDTEGDRHAYLKDQPGPSSGGLFKPPYLGVKWQLEPSNHYPGEDPGFGYKYNAYTDAFSISGNIRGLVHKICGFDIFEVFLIKISGDWDGLWKAADELENCGSAVNTVGLMAQRYANDLPAAWTGDAGEAARESLLRLGLLISARKDQYKFVAAEYRKMANLSWDLFDALGIVLGELLDKMAEIAIAVAAGTATIETVIGGVIGYGVAAYLVKEAVGIAMECSKLLTKIDNIVKVGKVTFGAFSSVSGPGPSLLPLPAPYQFRVGARPGEPGFIGPFIPTPKRPGEPGFIGPFIPTPKRPGEPGFIGPVIRTR